MGEGVGKFFMVLISCVFIASLFCLALNSLTSDCIHLSTVCFDTGGIGLIVGRVTLNFSFDAQFYLFFSIIYEIVGILIFVDQFIC